MSTLSRTAPLAALLLCCVAPLGVHTFAAEKSGAAFYRCKDARGQTHYSDSMPTECAGQDTEVLSDRGTVVRVIEGARSLAARAERQAVDDAARKEREAADLHDRMLIDTYLSIQDIERLRDQRMALLETQLRISEQNIAGLRDRQQRLAEQAKRFRPYNDKPDAPPLPDHVAEDMVNTVNGISVTEQNVTEKRGELKQLQAQFAADIERFKQLKGIK